MHGTLYESKCTECGHIRNLTCRDKNITEDSICYHCGITGAMGTLRHNVVWFGENIHHAEEISKALCEADIFVSVGTSGEVQPAASYVRYAKNFGAETISIDINDYHHPNFDIHLVGPATVVVPKLVEKFIAEYLASE
jgi:NAD-dependent deacetylase